MTDIGFEQLLQANFNLQKVLLLNGIPWKLLISSAKYKFSTVYRIENYNGGVTKKVENKTMATL